MVREISLKIHSIVDVITNSSTVIYTYCTEDCIKAAKELINMILKEAGSDKTADDLYTFTLDVDADTYAQMLEDIMDDPEQYGVPVNAKFPEVNADETDEEAKQWYADIQAFFSKYKIDIVTWIEDNTDDYPDGIHIKIKTKSGEETDFTNFILGTVILNASYG